jgi:O-antigen ligase
VKPISQHAIYFSVYTFIALVYLLSEESTLLWLKKKRMIYISWIIVLLFFLFLLSSKMVLLVVILFLLHLFFRPGKKKIRRWQAMGSGIFALLLIIAILSTDNPVHKRFIDLRGNMELLKQEKYDAGTYLNGWQFRLLLWRITYEIIRDKKAWFAGVGPANAQSVLEEKYLDLGLYAGVKNSGDHGYLQYNCHNQFLQTLLQSGIIGLLFFAGWCYLLFKKALQKKEPVLFWSVVILICFFFIESVCERQNGVILCTLIPLMFIYTRKNAANSDVTHTPSSL